MILVGNVVNYRLKFKRNFLNYSIASRLSREPNTAYQTSVFLSIISKEAYDINNGLNFGSRKDNETWHRVEKIWRIFRKLNARSLRFRDIPSPEAKSSESRESYKAAQQELVKSVILDSCKIHLFGTKSMLEFKMILQGKCCSQISNF